MLDEVWNTIRLNKIEKELKDFFKIISHIDDAMYGNKVGKIDKKTKNRYFF